MLGWRCVELLLLLADAWQCANPSSLVWRNK